MSTRRICYRPIGVIRTPFSSIEKVPIQPRLRRGAEGIVEVEARFEEALSDLSGFSYIILIYHFHLSRGYKPKVRPFLDDEERGLFATRAPRRPNPIGMSVVRLKKVDGRRLYIKGIDVVDGTPLLDIKPYVPEFDLRKDARIGWLEGKSHKARYKRADSRFA